MRLRLLSLLVFALVWPNLAHAWTDAHVREAHASLRLDPAQQRLEVTLDLAVEVRGGWLERLDLAGLDEGLAPWPEEAPYAVLDTGEQVPGKLILRGSAASVRFQRRDGLRRGVHHVVLRYVAPLNPTSARADGGTRVTWTLPGWESGLERGVIELSGPAGMSAVVDPELAQEVERQPEGAATLLRFTRVHVPRASPWEIAVELRAGDLGSERAASSGASAPKQSPGPRARTGAVLGAALLLLAAWRRRSSRSAGAELLVGWPVCAALAALGALCWAVALPLALLSWAALSWLSASRRAGPQPALPLGRVAALSGAPLAQLLRRHLRVLLGSPLGDIASVLGALGAGVLIGAVVLMEGALDTGADPWGLGALCALFGSIAGSRLWRARSTAEQVRMLLRAARRTRVVACGLSLCAYQTEAGPCHPRLRLVPGARYPGLLRLEVLIDARRGAPPLWLRATVEPGSASVRWLRALWPELQPERSAGGQQLALSRPIEEVGQAVEQLLEHLSRESQRSVSERPPATRAA